MSATGRATIAVEADTCGDVKRGEFQYNDRAAEVSLHGTVTAAQQCVTGLTTCQCQAAIPSFGNGFGDYEIAADYRSTDADRPGGGQLIACVSDNGEGSKASGPDTGAIRILSGPYAGYENQGAVQGNIQQHKCPGKSSF